MPQQTKHIKIIFTSDVHGNYFPYDFRHERMGKGSLQRVHALVAKECQANPASTLLLDGGDMLQGEATAYYYNYIQKGKRHKVSDICNYIGYDAAVIGNHDIETGHENFDRYVSGCNFPILGANVIDEEYDEPYFEPYKIFNRQGVRIAVIGLLTPAIPHWVPKYIWKGMRFEGVRESAEKWVKYLKENESPDFIIGLIHSGMDEGIVTPDYKENETRDTAENVEGLDLILYGHDHTSNMEEVATVNGGSVMCVNPGCYALSVAVVDVDFHIGQTGKVLSRDINCTLHYIGMLHNQFGMDFKRHFNTTFHEIKNFASEHLGSFLNRVDVTDAYFGSSAYIDLIQSLLLKVSGADISFTAPFFFNASVEAGEIKVSNLFDLYRFEDHLYTLILSGKEIKNYLEMSYSAWVNQMASQDDPMLQTCPMKNFPERIGFKNFIFNFDAASGIDYEVDLREPEGNKVRIIGMSDGRPFKLDELYTVAMTAYRANGGGELLTKGAGLTKEEIDTRIESVSEHDIRYHLMEYVRELGTINPQPKGNWRFIPEEWVAVATEREKEILFRKRYNNDIRKKT